MPFNESETRAEYIDPKLTESGWGIVEDTKILREHRFTEGRIQVGGTRAKPEIADYILVYKTRKLAVIEAKQFDLTATEGVTQAKEYAQKLVIDYTYSTNGQKIYQINMKTGKEEYVDKYPTPDELWNKTFSDQNEWKEKFNNIPFETINGAMGARYYQEIAVNKATDAIAENKQRILLTLATGTGKTFIAFQIAWKLFKSKWNLNRDGARQPRILFLADRNILADQAFNAFSAFPEDALIRISPLDIRKKGNVPTNGSVFFTIFQTFMSGPNNTPYYGDYPNDFFDFIIIDECHRGGANDESNWRGIMDYFSPAVQLGLTATPKRKDNVDTYRYFGDPIYTYSLKEGIHDGFLTPFKVKRVKTTLDDYVYTSDDEVVEGEVEQGKVYTEPEFNRSIEIVEREKKRVNVLLEEIEQKEKAIVFCASQAHALLVRDLINQLKDSSDPNYCVRVTANDGLRGEQYLREFQDNEKTIPTILTTSQKLSTGVDARNIRNIVLMRPINSMIEFKQIVGRGTRLFEGKEYFTIVDFVDAYRLFSDPEWDGEPIDEYNPPAIKPEKVKETTTVDYENPEETETKEPRKMIRIKLKDGKERQIQHMVSTSFWSADGKPMSAEEFIQSIYGQLPEFFKSEEELRRIWSVPTTRKAFLDKLADNGYGVDELTSLQKLVNAENSDLFDVLSYVSFEITPLERLERANASKSTAFLGLDINQKEFLEFVLSKYVENGYEELDEEKLPVLLNLKYQAIADAVSLLGGVDRIRDTFLGFQKVLYSV
ncbi:DEAD/DEAH box helicase [candidate division WWE3 bacterium]|jgi:type I restriction enzyme R subunit|uniref:DEAD/DEAH box helicase n=1 Tax=candidate division WWE3 bacterium TaxID=2053526 RepID=A0A3A4ZFX9_UNCKA|nr:MAG: DEAD/DEAH box helicase [candidate division WWE3 bacterium]